MAAAAGLASAGRRGKRAFNNGSTSVCSLRIMATGKKTQPLEGRTDGFFDAILGDLAPEDMGGLVVVGIKTRGEHLGRRLAERIKKRGGAEVGFGTIDITLYRDDFENRKNWPRLGGTSIPGDVRGKNVILVDDVLYTGRTARAAVNSIMDYGRPASVRLAVLVDRGGRELPIQPDWTGIRIETSGDEMVNVCLDEVDGREEIEIIARDGV